MSAHPSSAILHAGAPDKNMTVFRKVRVAVHDPVAFIGFESGYTLLIGRDGELERGRTRGDADEVRVYEEFEPEGGLSGDREIRAAQAVTECLRRRGVVDVIADRTLPLLYVETLRDANIRVQLDPHLGVADRRRKTADEREALREAQEITESAVRMACELIAGADTDDAGVLIDRRPGHDGRVLTSEVVKSAIISFLAEQGAVTEDPCVSGGPAGADCHWSGSGPLRSGEPVIVDIFPRHAATGFHGDCTRVVVHGDVSEDVAQMHAALLAAKAAGIAALRAGVTGEEVHLATVEVIQRHGFHTGWPPEHAPASYATMTHGTGHGIGLDLKELPLLDLKGPELVEGDCVPVEPGLYRPDTGGLRIEDMLIVTADGAENLNRLHEGLSWRV